MICNLKKKDDRLKTLKTIHSEVSLIQRIYITSKLSSSILRKEDYYVR